ncbi:MAG TPA: hypothetical protein VNE39_06075 [Planctomycetota bacterium]|nr:hypothetical protein [Planctomycetota bacterium]
MKRPTWATVAGVLGIISAGAGTLGSAQMVMMAGPAAQQRRAYGVLDQAVGSFTKPTGRPDDEFALVNETLRDFSLAMGRMTTPAWFPTWCIAGGVVGMFVAGALLVAASALLQMKRWAIVLFYCTAGLDIAWSLAKLAVISGTSSLVSMATPAWALPAIVIDVALLVVVAMGDKAAFRGGQPPHTGEGYV